MSNTTKVLMHFEEIPLTNQLFGTQNSHLTLLAEHAKVHFASRGIELTITGNKQEVALVHNLLVQLYALIKKGVVFSGADIIHAYTMLQKSPTTQLEDVFQGAAITLPRKTISPKSLNQKAYVEALKNTDITLAVGPAGTGKTYLAVAVALSMLSAKRINRIILTRPAVEAGERLGFLPGDLAEKINPYLRPLYDALHDMLDFERVNEMIEDNIIEIAPLAFMRGRTLNNAFIILDEAQNTTAEQMKMFLTRLGFNSRMALAGDITQIDLPESSTRKHSGFIHALNVLKNVEGIAHIQFDRTDVIRHPLVGRIINAYDKYQIAHSR